jgi:hypothetical protein
LAELNMSLETLDAADRAAQTKAKEANTVKQQRRRDVGDLDSKDDGASASALAAAAVVGVNDVVDENELAVEEIDFVYSGSDFDENGILYYIGTYDDTQAWRNPAAHGVVTVCAYFCVCVHVCAYVCFFMCV